VAVLRIEVATIGGEVLAEAVREAVADGSDEICAGLARAADAVREALARHLLEVLLDAYMAVGLHLGRRRHEVGRKVGIDRRIQGLGQADIAAEVERLPAAVAGAVARVCIRRGEGGLVESEDLVAARGQRGNPEEPERDEQTPREVAHASARERATVSSICEAVPQVILRRIVHLAPLGLGACPRAARDFVGTLGGLDGAAPQYLAATFRV